MQLQIFKDDPLLLHYQKYFQLIRHKHLQLLYQFQVNQKGINNFASSYLKYGLHRQGNQFIYKEWAPGAQELYVFGQFNNWNRYEYPCKKDEFGNWECRIQKNIPQFSLVKVNVKLHNDKYVDRIPCWINYCIQNQNQIYNGVYLQPSKFQFKYQNPKWQNTNVKIYECHIGMSGVQGKVHTYKYFKEYMIDRIADSGYNVIQLMAILEHPYYASFGYHVTNFFAASSRFGKPDQLKELVDYAHSKGIKILIDLVHAHASSNTNQGINFWDGTDYQYFHALPKGRHQLWDSRIFNYSKYQVLRFLLSNIKYWMTQYRVDGYRFDGITSMIYNHHGINYGFTGNYDQYFNQNLQVDALIYLILANNLVKSINKFSISIAQDVSGFPTLCRTFQQGGIGFDFRLTMAIPDMWIKLLKEKRDEDWDIGKIVYQLTNRRWKQKSITYAQSHDQALVGDKTLSMWLFDKQIYQGMSTLWKQQTPRVFRGMALHKMIRLITIGLGGQGYLNFMGNQFGHPQWIDFPREGNNWSYHYCRRRWDLIEDQHLRYRFLYKFDNEMLRLQNQFHFLSSAHQYISLQNNNDKVVVFQKGQLLFAFNFHFKTSFENYRIPCADFPSYKVQLTTDDQKFGGHNRIEYRVFSTDKIQFNGLKRSFLIYLPSRCAIVFRPT